MSEQQKLDAIIDAILDAATDEQAEMYRIEAGYLLLWMSEFLEPLDYEFICNACGLLGEQALRYQRCYLRSFNRLREANLLNEQYRPNCRCVMPDEQEESA